MIELFTSEQVDEATQYLARNFLRELMVAAVNINLEEMLQFSRLVVSKVAQFGLSYILKDE